MYYDDDRHYDKYYDDTMMTSIMTGTMTATMTSIYVVYSRGVKQYIAIVLLIPFPTILLQ